jgi:hypothetical protein
LGASIKGANQSSLPKFRDSGFTICMTHPYRRRWFQFGLRGLFWLTLAVAVGTVAGVKRYENHRMREEISQRELDRRQLFSFFGGLSR